MPESAYSSVDLEPPSENGDHKPVPLNRLDRSRSGAKEVILKADQFMRDSSVLVQPTLSKTKEAISSPSWKRISRITFFHVAAVSSIFVTITALAYVGQIPTYVYDTENDIAQTVCQPDGTFNPEIYWNVYNNWSPSGFFQITLGFGKLKFSTVKIIDVVWDVVVGRGGQALLAGTSYIIFSKSLLRIMERDSVSYGTFEVLGFQTASVSTIFKLLRDYLTNRGLRARLVIMWIILSSVYIVAFPTLASAMSGYSANSEAFVEDYTGALTPWSQFRPVQYVLHDGWRVGLTGRYLLTDVNSYNSNAWSSEYCSDQNPFQSQWNPDTQEYDNNWTSISKNCTLIWDVSTYAQTYGLNGGNHTRSSFNNSGHIIDLPPPILNITAHQTFSWSNFFGGSSMYDYAVQGPLFALDNDTYSVSYIEVNGQCFPQQTYRWGFSFLLLFITTLLTAIWTIGMYIMWLDAYLYSRFDRGGRDMGTHRAALDFAAAMRKDIGEDATEDLSNTELKKRVRKGLNGWRVGYEMTDGDKTPLGRAQDAWIFWNRYGWKQWSRRNRIAIVGGGSALVLVVILIASLTIPRAT